METQEDRLRRMKREREGTASASWELNPGVPRETGVAQVTWGEKPKPTSTAQSSWGAPETSTAQVTWSPNTPEGLAAEIAKPKPVYTATNGDGSPNYNVPEDKSHVARSGRRELEEHHDEEFEMGNIRSPDGTPYRASLYDTNTQLSADGGSIRRQLKYLDELQHPSHSHRGLYLWPRFAGQTHQEAADDNRRHAGLPAEGREQPDMPVFKEGDTIRVAGGENWKPSPAMDVAPPAPKVAAAEEPKPAVVARPVGLQAPEVPQPAEAVAERPKMEQIDPKAAVQPEPVPMPAKPMNPQQRMLAGKGEWRNIASQPTLAKHYQAAAKQLGLGPMGSIAFGKLSPEQVNELRTTAHDLQREASGAQFDDRLSDRNQAKSENIPIALATAQRLQGRGNALIAEAAGLHEADPDKAAKHAAGTALLTQGNTKSADFWRAWQQQADAHREQEVMRASMVYGRDGAGIVEAHIRGQQEMARARLVDQGNRDDRKAAEDGLNKRAGDDNNVRLAIAGMNVTAQEIEQQRDREQRIAELKERERLHGLDQAQREKLAKDERDAAAHRQKLDLADRQKGREAQAAQNPVPMQPAQQRAQLWEPLKAADSNPDDQTPVQQHVDDFMQTLASQEGLQPQQREIQRGQVKAWANQHVMSRWENDRLRDSDRGYIRSLVYATDAEGNNTGKLKDRSTFVREMGGHYKGNNWAGMAAKLAAFYDRLKKEEEESGNLTQVGIPDYPVV